MLGENYCILDLETENNKYLKRTASPFCHDNYVVAIGWKHEGCSGNYTYYEHRTAIGSPLCSDTMVLVGHNIKFDLLYLWEYEWLQDFFKRGGMIWDTQYAEYLLSAQHPKSHMNALNDISEKYGGTKKYDVVKAMWEAGKKTSEIPKDVLIDYLIGNDEYDGDIGNTEKVYLGQLEKAKKLGMLTSIERRMNGLLATTMMEYNGVYVDMEEAKARLEVLEEEYKELQVVLQSYVPALPEGMEFMWTSKHQVSALVFGGAIKYTAVVPMMKDGSVVTLNTTEKWPLFNGSPINPNSLIQHGNIFVTGHGLQQDVFLSGRRKGEPKFGNVLVPVGIKTKKETFIFDFPGYVTREEVLNNLPAPKDGWILKQTDARGVPLMKTGSDAMEILAQVDVPFVKVLTRFVALDKEIGTYYIRTNTDGTCSGMLSCVDTDSIIHHSLNHTSTVTGRLSSSNPNMQNLTRGGAGGSQVKRMFSSRFTEGYMVEIDYSQIEVVVLALLSGDKNLIHDLNSGVDFHCKRVAIKNGISYVEAVQRCKDESHPDHVFWKAERTKCKIFGFQMQYGAGAKAIARDTGMSVEEVQDLLNKEKELYPDVEKFIASVRRQVESTAKPFRDPQRGFRSFRRGYFKSCTGTRYTFRSYDAPEFMRKHGITESFSPPEMRNYPVQGLAGEVVQLGIGKVLREHWWSKSSLLQSDAVLCNTVHDCIWVDCRNRDIAEAVSQRCARSLQDVGTALEQYFGIECPVQFNVAVEIGKNMLELHGINHGVQ